MDIAVYNKAGEKEGDVAVSDRLFHAKPNADLVYQVATSQMSNNRRVIAHAKTRAEVSGTGKKPWRQKGTGRARHGSMRSPIWVGGGVAHGPSKDVNFKRKINKAQGRAAFASVLSSRVAEGRFLVVDELAVPTGKTKDAVALIAALGKQFKDYGHDKRMLMVLAGTTDDLPIRKATANLQQVDTIRAQDLNTLTVLSYPFMVASKAAVANMEKTFAKTK
ncbi:MAG TPA: 50S ribosomal protein L4 [Candidatus Paceibacterota bacterium]|nr:50S ribosomal protein L4 [Candidatus Paceibacterota bacterium]